MQIALVEGLRRLPAPNLTGSCPTCGARTVAKCGQQVIWHWSHAGRRHCDLWWENETEWHRRWKSFFPETEREIVHFDAQGEKHVADVKTSSGLVLELQNSPMALDELRSREKFYGNMIWIVNALPFKRHFHILSRLPDPKSPFAQDLVFCEQRVDWLGRNFWRRSENPDYHGGSNDLVRLHHINEVDDGIGANYVGHHLFHWTHPREIWHVAGSPVYFDFDDDDVWSFQHYDEARQLRCVRRYSKRALIVESGGTYTPNPSLTAESPTA